MCHLQKLHEQFSDKGIVILGFNSSDDKEIAVEFLAENGATFPTVLDSSDAAIHTAFRDYRVSGVPVNYIIDREGKVVDAWYGYEKGHRRALAALEKTSSDLAEAIGQMEPATDTHPALRWALAAWAKASGKLAEAIGQVRRATETDSKSEQDEAQPQPPEETES